MSIASGKKKPISPADAFEMEFTQRLLDLFVSFYGAPLADPIRPFPPDPGPNFGEPPPRPPPFHASVWGLRLRKAAEIRLAQDQMASDSLSEQVLQLRNTLADAAAPSHDAFRAPRAQRPSVPTYLQNLDRDRKALLLTFKAQGRARRANIAQMQQLFAEHLAKRNALTAERSEKRKELLRKTEREIARKCGGLHKAPRPEDLDIKSVAKAQERARREERKSRAEKMELLASEVAGGKRNSPRRERPKNAAEPVS
jgi:hypothetical protein